MATRTKPREVPNRRFEGLTLMPTDENHTVSKSFIERLRKLGMSEDNLRRVAGGSRGKRRR